MERFRRLYIFVLLTVFVGSIYQNCGTSANNNPADQAQFSPQKTHK